MKVINISTDRNIFDNNSPVFQRMREYGNIFDELHVIVFSLKKHGYKKNQISSSVWVYPTNSRWRITYFIKAFFIARKICVSADAEDVVISTQDPFETGLVGLFVKITNKIRLNVQVHSDIYSPFFVKNSFLNKIRVRIAPYIFKKADNIRVVSERISKSLQDKGINREKISVLPIYVDKGEYDNFQDVTRKDSMLLAVSRLTSEKNLFFLVDVINDVVDKKPDVQLVVVGDGPLREELSLYVVRRKLEQNIKFVGWKNNVAKYYGQAGLLVHTSMYEGYGMVFIEAALRHVPIVSSDVGIMGDVFVNNRSAQVCPVGDKECFVKYIIEMLEDTQKSQQISDVAYKNVAKHLADSKEQYLAKYKEAVCGY